MCIIKQFKHECACYSYEEIRCDAHGDPSKPVVCCSVRSTPKKWPKTIVTREAVEFVKSSFVKPNCGNTVHSPRQYTYLFWWKGKDLVWLKGNDLLQYENCGTVPGKPVRRI